MKLYRLPTGIVIEHEQQCYHWKNDSWDDLLTHDYRSLLDELTRLEQAGDTGWLEAQSLLAPVGSQEIWAAGVTYLRSKVARMEESGQSGGASFYDKVYDAERPELFFKSNGFRAIGQQGMVRIRKDSDWNVPEPELTLVVNSSSKIIGYTIGNDMSSRSIEGENPLYLPQAKMYDGSAALGPCVWLTEDAIAPTTSISICIERDGADMYTATTTIDQMKRKHEELVGYLFREYSFPHGAYLMTGTCLVPGNDFSLQHNDTIRISIDGIGTLVNHVA